MLSSNKSSHAIGVFDSGFGGLTVLQQLIHLLPQESFIYYGDTARLPYGEKSRETIIRYSIENTIFLLEKNIKLLVVACNTATAHALEKLQHIFNIPVVGVIDPCAEYAVRSSKNRRIAVLGTKGTINSQSYQKAILRHAPDAFILPISCPLFVPLVEEHYIDHVAARLIVQDYLKPMKDMQIDTVVLGCTHYPLLKSLIRSELGDEIDIIDSSTACARTVTNILAERELYRREQSDPIMQYFVSDDPLRFQSFGHTFLGRSIEKVEVNRIY